MIDDWSRSYLVIMITDLQLRNSIWFMLKRFTDYIESIEDNVIAVEYVYVRFRRTGFKINESLKCNNR